MLFNSYIFLFAFLPLTVVGFLALSRFGRRSWTKIWITACSLYFYAWFDVSNLWVIFLSIAGNLALARAINAATPNRRRSALFGLGVAANLLLLCYYKYTRFFFVDVLSLFDVHVAVREVDLPLGISFFTFQQIIFLRDIRRGSIESFSNKDYVFCVTFFPHLIAGPIIKYKHILKQLKSHAFLTISPVYISYGLSWLILGLCKKVLIADNLAPFANEVFQLASANGAVSSITAWVGALAYCFQIYFDFSGYSDMAIGLALLFKIELPPNFNSPYKAHNVVEFWRRWHMTLSWFLRECLYIPLGGNREGHVRQLANLLLTMLLGGLWHGAGWGFLVWGGLHGLGLCYTHVGQYVRGGTFRSGPMMRALSVATTFVFVTLAWVFFRAATLSEAQTLVSAMLDVSCFNLADAHSALFRQAWPWLAGCLALSWLAPNTQQILAAFKPRVERYLENAPPAPALLRWRPNIGWAVLLGVLFLGLTLNLSSPTEFLYFQF